MWDILKDNWLLLLIGQYPHGPLGGLAATLGLAAISLVLALPCGVLLALGRISPWRCLRWPATAVVQLVRGLPLLMFIFWAYFFVPIVIGRLVAGTTTMVVALVCYESAYLAEIIRAGIQALPSGQQEAGRALGLSYLQTMRRVILPQALYNMLPSMLSQFVSTVKETSLAYVISAGADLCREPGQQRAADQALRGIRAAGADLFHPEFRPEFIGPAGRAAHRPAPRGSSCQSL